MTGDRVDPRPEHPKWGIRYLIVALGDRDDPAEQADVDVTLEYMTAAIPFKVTALSPRVCDQLTVALLRDMGAMP